MNMTLNSILHPTSRGRVRMIFIGIVMVTFLAATLDFPQYYNKSVDWTNKKIGTSFSHFWNKPFRLGLDLQGGTHLIYDADTSKLADAQKIDAVEGVRNVIEKRVNAFGVSEPLVQTTISGSQYRIIVELAGIKDINKAIEMIGKTPLLEFKEQNNEPPREMTEAEKKDMAAYNQNAQKKADDVFKKVKENIVNFPDLANEYSDDPLNTDNLTKKGGDMGYLSASGMYMEIYDAAKEAVDKSQKPKSGAAEEKKKNDLDVFSLDNVNNSAAAPENKIDVLVDKIVETEQGYNIIKVEDKKDTEEKEYRARHILICWKGAEGCDKDWSKEDAKKKIEEIKKNVNVNNFAKLAQDNSTEPGAKERGGNLGWFKKGQMVPEFENAVSQMKTGAISDIVETKFGYHLIFKAEDRPIIEYKIRRILIAKKSQYDYVPPQGGWKNTGLSGEHLTKADAQFDQTTGEPQINLEFNDEGRKLFAEITERNVNKPVGIFLDGSPLSTPNVSEPIREGRAVINGKFSINEAKDLARDLNAGALPVPIKLVNQQNVGATLGEQTVQSGIKAAIWGFILVILYMLIVYKLPGLLSGFALLSYAFINLAIYKLWPITLTLSGLAGLILSFGMGVDASVLIFERMKEELRTGKPLASAMRDGFIKTWPSIRDGNLSTLITCLILIKFGSSMIRGFAITLSIGILISIMTNLFVMRNFAELVGGWAWFKERVRLFGGKKKKEEGIAAESIRN